MPSEYGTRTPAHALDELLAYSGTTEYKAVLYHPQIPVDARLCQKPGSTTVEVVLLNDNTIKATRHLNGLIVYSGC